MSKKLSRALKRLQKESQPKMSKLALQRKWHFAKKLAMKYHEIRALEKELNDPKSGPFDP